MRYVIILLLVLCSCSTYRYIGVPESKVKQEIKKDRQAAGIAGTVFVVWFYLFTTYGE